MVNYNSGVSGAVYVLILGFFLFCFVNLFVGLFVCLFGCFFFAIIPLSVETVLRGQLTLSGHTIIPSEWPLITGSTVSSNKISIKTGQSNCSWFKFNRYLSEEFRSLNTAFRDLLMCQWPESGIFFLQWILYWTFLSIHSRSFLGADYLRILIPEWNIFGIHLRIIKNWIFA